jgi:molecular chaperone DnaJ
MAQREWVEKDFYKELGVSSDASEQDAEFNLNDLFDAAGQTGGANIGDLFGGLFGRGAQQPRPTRPRRGNDLETETELSFLEATKGVMMPLRLTSPAPCTNCHGSGARPGTSPKVCPNCNGSGVISRNQGAFGFSEPCTECRGSGSIIEHPCDECKGTGVTTRTRTINVRIPPGVEDGQRIRLAGQGEAGLRGAPSGDLYVTVHVKPDKVFGRNGDDLTVSVPVSFHDAFGADAGGQGRRSGAQGHLRWPDPARAWSRRSEALGRPRRPARHREGGGATGRGG